MDPIQAGSTPVVHPVSERWLPIVDPSGRHDFPDYYVSDFGRVASCRGSEIVFLKLWRQGRGYLCATLSMGMKEWARTFLVHKLVLTAFRGPCPKGCESRHLDGDKNNNALTNLEWGTPKQNHDDKVAHGTATVGVRNGRSKLDPEKVREIKRRLVLGDSGEQLGREFGVSGPAISDIRHNVTWKEVPWPWEDRLDASVGSEKTSAREAAVRRGSRPDRRGRVRVGGRRLGVF